MTSALKGESPTSLDFRRRSQPTQKFLDLEKLLRASPPKRIKAPVASEVATQPLACVLSAQDLPLVSETEHAVGYCYCHLCTCGRHPCPAAKFRKIPSKSSFATTYKKSFQPLDHKSVDRLSRPPIVYRTVRKANDLTTTHRQDYKPLETSQSPPVALARSFELDLSPKLGFAGRSSLYHRDFPEWNPGKPVVYGPMQVKHALGKCQARLVSVYRDTYKAPLVLPTLKPIPCSQPKIKAEFIGESTSQAMFTDKSVEALRLNPVVKTTGKATTFVKGVKTLKSSYRDAYQNLVAKWLPRRRMH